MTSQRAFSQFRPCTCVYFAINELLHIISRNKFKVDSIWLRDEDQMPYIHSTKMEAVVNLKNSKNSDLPLVDLSWFAVKEMIYRLTFVYTLYISPCKKYFPTIIAHF